MISYSRFTHHYTKSYFKFIEPLSSDYTVFLGDEEIPVYTCRISGYPFNCVWPGHQRPFNQSEPASFVNLVSDEPVTLTVRTTLTHDRILLKPLAKEIDVREENGTITFTLSDNGAYVLECGSYHHCLYVFNNKPIPAPEPSSVTHFFGPGIHIPGKIILHSGESVYVDKDAMVYGCIFAENAENIRIFGNGIFDDTGEGRIDPNCYEDYTNGNVKFYDCRNIRVEGVHLRNSAIWCVNLFHCFDVVIDGVSVFGQWRYNTDGVDVVNSQDVVIRNSFIHSFDDTITIKGIDRFADTNCERILVENCVLWCDWGKTCEIGIETACREYRGITFRNCDILRADNTALDIQNGDCAEISDITFENITVEYNSFDTEAVYQASDDMTYGKEDTHTYPALVSISNHRFRTPASVAAWGIPGELLAGIDLKGITPGSVRDVTVKNVRVYYDERLPRVDGRYHTPLWFHSWLDNVVFRNVTLSGLSVNGLPITKENAVLHAVGVQGLTLDGEILA